MAWTRAEDGTYRLSLQVRMPLTRTELAWAIHRAFEGATLHEVSANGDYLTFDGDQVPRREVRNRVLATLARHGTAILPSTPPPQPYLDAATAVYRTPGAVSLEGDVTAEVARLLQQLGDAGARRAAANRHHPEGRTQLNKAFEDIRVYAAEGARLGITKRKMAEAVGVSPQALHNILTGATGSR